MWLINVVFARMISKIEIIFFKIVFIARMCGTRSLIFGILLGFTITKLIIASRVGDAH